MKDLLLRLKRERVWAVLFTIVIAAAIAAVQWFAAPAHRDARDAAEPKAGADAR